ncbi:MAG: hypothetical protein K9K88_05020 [Desulfobacterales bacterium]|nr:hypothetical protein [Desulfobacterales bacterium]
MNENEYFSDEYAPEDVTGEKSKKHQPTVLEYEKKEVGESYLLAKPQRVIIKARITHD